MTISVPSLCPVYFQEKDPSGRKETRQGSLSHQNSIGKHVIHVKASVNTALLEGIEDARVNTDLTTGAINLQTRNCRYTHTRTRKYESKDPHKLLRQRLVVESSIFMHGGLLS